MSRPLLLAVMLLPLVLLAGCPLSGGESAEAVAARKEAEGKAVGGACRHAGRAIEDCFALNKRADKAALFGGWREMNDYMRENKIEPVPPQGAVVADAAEKSEKPAGDSSSKKADTPVREEGSAKKPPKPKKQDG
jgi:hypothetical protein